MLVRRAIPLLAVAAVVAGCGSTPGGPETSGPSASGVAARAAAPLRVAVTDARIGDATTANDLDGLRELPVGPRRVDPDAAGRQGRAREGVGAGASCAGTDTMPAADTLSAVQTATLCLLNGERADRGLGALSENARLAAAAIAHTRDMVDAGYFDHAGRDGHDVVDRVRATGYLPAERAWTVGENLAWGTGNLATPVEIVRAWMNSPGHRANILNGEYREIGFGIVTGNPRRSDGQGATYTTNFGAVSGGSAPDSSPAPESVQTITKAPAAQRSSTAKRRAAKRRAARAKRARRARAARRAAKLRISRR